VADKAEGTVVGLHETWSYTAYSADTARRERD
jgi:hypothetical protein